MTDSLDAVFNIDYIEYMIKSSIMESKMSQTTMTVRLSGQLSEFAASNVGENGSFESMSEYIRSLIREDKERSELVVFNKLKTELELAFSAKDSTYSKMNAADIFARN